MTDTIPVRLGCKNCGSWEVEAHFSAKRQEITTNCPSCGERNRTTVPYKEGATIGGEREWNISGDIDDE